MADVAGELASYADGLDADPLRLAAVEERRAALNHLTRKYGQDIAAVLAWSEESATASPNWTATTTGSVNWPPSGTRSVPNWANWHKR